MSKCPKIILYICTKQINFLRNSSEGHFRTPSLSWYSFSDPQMTRVARLCIDSILLMCFTKYGFQTWQPYSKIGRTKVLYAVETLSELFRPKVRLIKPRTLLALAQIYLYGNPKTVKTPVRHQGACGDLLQIRVGQTTSTHDDMDPWISVAVGPWTFRTSE